MKRMAVPSSCNRSSIFLNNNRVKDLFNTYLFGFGSSQ